MASGPLVSVIRHAARRLSRDLGHSAVLSLLFAVGIGTSLLGSRLVWGIVYAPLPYPQPESLVLVSMRAPGADVGLDRVPLSAAGYLHFRERAGGLTTLSAFHERQLSVSLGERTERVDGARATAGLLPVLRVAPAIGRWLSDEDCRPGAPPVAVLSHRLWQQAHGGSPEVLGETVSIDGVATSVVGVLPAGFAFPWEETEIWIPLTIDASAPDAGNHWLRGVARLSPGVSAAQAETELQGLLPGLSRAFPEVYSPRVLEEWQLRVVVRDLRAETVRQVRPALTIFAAGIGLILAVCCSNASLLFLGRLRRRAGELALRRSLGAGRSQLAFEALAEPLLLALLAGGGGGVVGTMAAQRAAALDLPFRVPRLGEVLGGWAPPGLGPLIVVGVALAAATPALLGLRRIDPIAELRGGSSYRPPRSSLALAGVQIALSLILVFGSTLLVRSGGQLQASSLGFEDGDSVTFGLSLPEATYPTAEARVVFTDRLLASLRSLPGVRIVGAGSGPPLAGSRNAMLYTLDKGAATAADSPVALRTSFVDPSYFRAVGLALRRGRSVGPTTGEEGPRELVVNEVFTRRFYPAQSPIGRRVGVGDEQWFEIVGEVASLRDVDPGSGPEPMVYFPLSYDNRWLSVAVRSELPAETVMAVIRDRVRALDPRLPVEDPRTLAESIRAASWRLRLLRALLAAGALLALLVSASATFGVVSQMLGGRQHELAIRLALGASSRDLSLVVLRSGLPATLAGVGAGLLGGLLLGRLLRSLLFDVGSSDPGSLLVGGLVVVLCVALAAALPLRRLVSLQPAQVLKRTAGTA